MSLQTHVHDTVPGVIGTAAAGGFTLLGFITDAVPILQVISLLAGIAVAVVTFMYYQHKLAVERIEDQAILAAAALKAQAELTATALAKAAEINTNATR
jgi:hypothetical protein